MASRHAKSNLQHQSWPPALEVYFAYVFACKMLETPLSPTCIVDTSLSCVHEQNPTAYTIFSTGLWLRLKGNPSKLSMTNPSSTMISIILLLSEQISPNPGPCRQSRGPRYPCVTCGKAVRSNQKGIQCDNCQLWTHASCVNMSNNTYDNICNTSNLWFCEVSNLPDQSTSFFTPNPYSGHSEPDNTDLSDVTYDHPIQGTQSNTQPPPPSPLPSPTRSPGPPLHASSPSHTRSPNPNNLHVLQLNFNILKSTTKSCRTKPSYHQSQPRCHNWL